MLIILFFSCSSYVDTATKESKIKIPTVKSEQTFDVLIEEGIVYAKGLRHERLNSESAKVIPLKLDVYSPKNDIINRPVLMLIHGGGFAGGSKAHNKIVRIANYFASRGWVAISIDYRLKRDKGTVPQEWIDYSTNVPSPRVAQFLAMYPAHRDAKAALRWIVAHAKTYSINTDYITVGGGSAGAITAITLGISSQDVFKDEIDTTLDYTLTTTNLEQSYQIKTILDFWGSKIALDVLDKIYEPNSFKKTYPSLFIVHGTEDSVVPFTNAEDLKKIYESNKAPYVFHPCEGYGHGCWNATIEGKSLVQLAFEFIVEQQKLKID